MNQNESALPIGSILQEYEIESVLGVGGFGITYLAKDINLHKKVAIKEYLPNDIALRKESNTVVPKSHNDNDNFKWGLERFLLEAQTLAKFNHPNIIKISRFFRANDTAYFVMDFEKGQDLEKYLKAKNNSLSEEEIYNIIMPILDGLREVHSVEYLHRDIKPANILIRESDSPVLIDFGASRFAMGAKSKSLSVVLTEGYAPKEQYSSSSIQGAYTDIYAIGAVMYKMVTGTIPVESSERANAITDDEPDPYQRLQDMSNIAYSENFKKAVDWALEFKGKDRPQSVREFQDALMGSVDTDTDTSRNIRKIEEPTLSDTKTEQETKQITKEEGKSSTMPILIVLLIALLAVGGWYLKTTQDEKVAALQQELEQRQRESQANANRAQQIADDTREATRKAEENLQKQIEEAKRIAVQKAQEDAKEAERIAREAQEKAKRIAVQKAQEDAKEAERIAREAQEEAQKQADTSKSSIRSFLRNYYSKINKSKYSEGYSDLSSRFKDNISYSKYYDWFSGKVEYIKLDTISSLEKTDTTEAIAKVHLLYLKTDGKFQCSDDTLRLVYSDRWKIDKQNYSNCQAGVKEYEENGIKLKVEYPLYVVKGKKALFKISMTNDTSFKKGGVTVGFPQYSSVYAMDEGSTFHSAKNYNEHSKLWSGAFKKSIYSHYHIFEGWDESWHRYETKTLFFALNISKADNVKLLIRSIMSKKSSERRNPIYGTVGQQGYHNIELNIPVIEK